MMAAKRNEGIVERVTVKTIAEMANVSIGTVDRALNGRGRINPDTKERILKIAKMMNYTPNRTAQALKRQRQIRIGIVMADTPIQFCDHLRHGIEDALGEMDDYGIVGEFLLSHSLSARDQMEVVSGIEPERFNAFLINAGSEEIGGWIDQMADQGKIVATFNSDTPNSRRLFHVGENPYRAGMLIGGYISQCLDREDPLVAILTGFPGNTSHDLRCRGVMDTIASLYPSVRFLQDNYYDSENVVEEKLNDMLIRRKEDVDAIFLSSGIGIDKASIIAAALPQGRRPMVFGYDINADVLPFMDMDICRACAFQDPYWQSYYAMTILGRCCLSGKKPTREFYKVRTKLITKYNAADYLMDKQHSDEFLI